MTDAQVRKAIRDIASQFTPETLPRDDDRPIILMQGNSKDKKSIGTILVETDDHRLGLMLLTEALGEMNAARQRAGGEDPILDELLRLHDQMTRPNPILENEAAYVKSIIDADAMHQYATSPTEEGKAKAKYILDLRASTVGVAYRTLLREEYGDTIDNDLYLPTHELIWKVIPLLLEGYKPGEK